MQSWYQLTDAGDYEGKRRVLLYLGLERELLVGVHL
jgi:hypothetical protein